MEYDRSVGLAHARVSYERLKDKVELVFDENKIGYKLSKDFFKLTFEEWGKLSELCYILTYWKITEKELKGEVKDA